MNFLITLKGFLIGTSMLIPGVSGGTMSMVFGIYDQLLACAGSFGKQYKKGNARFLFLFSLGAGLSFLLLSGPMAALNRRYPSEMAFFVTGAILGGIPVIYRSSDPSRLSFKSLLFFFFGLSLVFLSGHLPRSVFGAHAGTTAILLQLFSGIFGAMALVLPGISFSSMLYMMGVYDIVFRAVGEKDLIKLFPFGTGCLLGIFFLTRFLGIAIKRFPHPSYMIILGFVTGSLGDIFSGIPSRSLDTFPVLSILSGLSGFLLIRFFSRFEKKRARI